MRIMILYDKSYIKSCIKNWNIEFKKILKELEKYKFLRKFQSVC